MPIFEYHQANPERAQEFTAAMAGLTAMWSLNVADLIDTSGVSVAVDVGGANGALLRMLQRANPVLRGIVFDRPDIAAAVEADVADDRTEAIGGDFFEAVPSADLYLLKLVLHDWDDESCVRILRRCREAMKPGGRIVIIDSVIGDDADAGFTAVSDLNMLVVAGGKERSLAEFDALLAEAGLQRAALRPTDSPQSIIEAVAA